MKKIDEILEVVGIKTKERPLPEDWEVIEKEKTEAKKYDPEYFSVSSVVKDSISSSKKASQNNSNTKLVNEEFQNLLVKTKEKPNKTDHGKSLDEAENNNLKDDKKSRNPSEKDCKENKKHEENSEAGDNSKGYLPLQDVFTGELPVLTCDKSNGAQQNNIKDIPDSQGGIIRDELTKNDQLSHAESVSKGPSIVSSRSQNETENVDSKT